MRLLNGEYKQNINGVEHWIKIEGAENQTTPLVIIHGGPGGNLYSFERTIGPLLSKDRVIIYYEQRGCGRSGSPEYQDAFTFKDLIKDFNGIHEWIGHEKVDLFGYSFGGELALEITHTLPSKLNKVILSSPSLIGLKSQYLFQIVGFMSIAESKLLLEIRDILEEPGTIEEKYQRVWNAADLPTIDRLFFENQEIAKEFRRLNQESQMKNTGLMLHAIQNNPPVIPLIDRLKDIKQNILIITGIQDRNSGVPISNLIHKNLVNSDLTLFEKSAHFPYLEEPELFVEHVNSFLQ